MRADIQNYWYELISNYDFKNGSFTSLNQESHPYHPEITSVSNPSPEINEWVDITLRVKSDFTSKYYDDYINFSVRENEN